MAATPLAIFLPSCNSGSAREESTVTWCAAHHSLSCTCHTSSSFKVDVILRSIMSDSGSWRKSYLTVKGLIMVEYPTRFAAKIHICGQL